MWHHQEQPGYLLCPGAFLPLAPWRALPMPRPRLPIRPDEKIRPIAARDDLISRNLGLVHTIARDLYRTSILCRRLGTEDDLVSVGHLALVRAAERWRCEGHGEFGTY